VAILLRIILIFGIATVTGVAILFAVQAIGTQIPGGLVDWLPRLLGLDGESAYDAGLVAFFLEWNLLGLLVHTFWKCTTRRLGRA
jgi:hypothetical protein